MISTIEKLYQPVKISSKKSAKSAGRKPYGDEHFTGKRGCSPSVGAGRTTDYVAPILEDLVIVDYVR